MFLRHKRIGNGKYTYVYLVESVYEDGRTRQHIIRNLGRREEVEARGDLERLAASAARLSRKALVLSAEARGAAPVLGCRRIGPGLIFERLWTETGCRAVLEAQAGGRKFGFALERAVFVTVLHRLMVSGSDRAADKWREDYAIEGSEPLRLHHLYRTMAWLGQPLAGEDEAQASPHCVKHLIEEALFAHRRDLFSTLDVVFMDTTSLYFEGAGGQTLGRRGYSKDHRPDLNQMVVSVVLDGEGRPVCSETWPGNTADVTTLMPIVERLRERFAIRRVCVVADRGMISAETIAALEERKLEYILGVRERSDKRVRELVLADEAPFVPLAVDKRGKTVEYGAKAVELGGTRYIVCVNHNQAAKDAAERAAILESLERQLKRGDKALVGNAGYRRYLKTAGTKRFAIDADKSARRHAALQAAVDRRAGVPHHQGHPRHEADLPQARRDHPRPRVLLVPGPRAQERAHRPPRRPGRQAGMGRRARRPRARPGGRAHPRGQARPHAHAADRHRRQGLPGHPRRAAAGLPGARARRPYLSPRTPSPA
jgi:hypothetical protein